MAPAKNMRDLCKEVEESFTLERGVKLASWKELGGRAVLCLVQVGWMAMTECFAVYAWKAGESDVAIRGHFSEWTSEVVLIGRVSLWPTLMGVRRYAMPHGGTYEQRRTICGEYFGAAGWVPSNAIVENGGIEAVDAGLEDVYDQMREAMNGGWAGLAYEGILEAGVSRAFLSALTLYALFISVIYAQGIFATGRESYRQYNMGENPSIGGHTCQWPVEAIFLWATGCTIGRDLINYGKAARIREIVGRNRSPRVKEVGGQVIGALPSNGWLKVPPSYKYFD